MNYIQNIIILQIPNQSIQILQQLLSTLQRLGLIFQLIQFSNFYLLLSRKLAIS